MITPVEQVRGFYLGPLQVKTWRSTPLPEGDLAVELLHTGTQYVLLLCFGNTAWAMARFYDAGVADTAFAEVTGVHPAEPVREER